MRTNAIRTNVLRTNVTRTEDSVYYLPAKSARAAAQTQELRYELLKAGFYVTGGALIGFGLANFPAFSTALLTALNILPPHVI